MRKRATLKLHIGDCLLEACVAKSLFDTELKRNADVYDADMPAQLVMVNALSTVYPCQ